MEQYTKRLAEFACDLEFQNIPSDVISHLKVCILDTLGCGIFGATTPWGRILSDYIHSFDKNEESTIWGSQLRSTASNAALVNGAMVHGFELDDYHTLARSHPGGIAVTSALGVAEQKGRVSGKDFLTAVAAGYELLIRLAVCCGISLFNRGFHPTGTCGTIGSAAAAAKILKLDEEGMLNAIGISTSSPSGLMAAQYGAMVKRLFPGKAAQSGVIAAQLASRGFTGIKNVLEAEFGSFCKALSDDYDLTKLTAGLGKEYEIKNVSFKKYSCVGTNSTALDAVRKIMDEHSFEGEKINRIKIKVNNYTKLHSGWDYKAEGIMAAQMNMDYCTAVMLLEGDCFVDQFSEEKLKDPKILKVIDRIDVVVDPEIDKLPLSYKTAVVEIELKNGERLAERVDYPRGHFKNPMGYEEIKSKFEKLAKKKLDSKKVNSIITMVEKLEEVKDIKWLSQLLVP